MNTTTTPNFDDPGTDAAYWWRTLCEVTPRLNANGIDAATLIRRIRVVEAS